MKWWDGLKTVLLMTCQGAAPLIAHAIDQKLAAQDRAAVQLHLGICRNCRRYRGQLLLMRRVLSLIAPRPLQADGDQLSADAKARIRVELERFN